MFLILAGIDLLCILWIVSIAAMKALFLAPPPNPARHEAYHIHILAATSSAGVAGAIAYQLVHLSTMKISLGGIAWFAILMWMSIFGLPSWRQQ